MILLPSVTLVCANNIDIRKSINILKYCNQFIYFPQIKLFTNSQINDIVPKNIEIIKTIKLNDTNDYSEFIIHQLNDHINTEYVLIVQNDGYIANHNAWSDEFLKYDYIGAPWFIGACHVDGFPAVTIENRVGNGGFSLRSKKLLTYIQELTTINANVHPEDVYICRQMRNILCNLGIKFAPFEIASKFSLEVNHVDSKYNGQFGWHGWRTKRENPFLDHING